MSLVGVEACSPYNNHAATGGSGAVAKHTTAAIHHRAICHRFTPTSLRRHRRLTGPWCGRARAMMSHSQSDN
jgi:hypothetical protein